MYRKGDLLTALSWALGTTRKSTRVADEEQDQSGEQQGFGDPEYKHQLLHEAGQIVNELIHNEIKRLQRYEQGSDLKTVSVTEFQKSVNPSLWNFIVDATKSVRELHSSTLTSKKGSTIIPKWSGEPISVAFSFTAQILPVAHQFTLYWQIL